MFKLFTCGNVRARNLYSRCFEWDTYFEAISE